MVVKNYEEALELCRIKTNELVDKRKLKEYCKKHDLDYHKVQVFIRGDEVRRYPKLICAFLKTMGYKVSSVRVTTFEFVFD